KRSKRLMSF
ncbi:nitrite/Sulfite reductase ferredoxin-like half domain protein, partial [Vibrio parahaemolyticus V-223/04]